MQTYSYEIIDKSNNRVTGLIIDAKDKFEVISNFQSKDYKIVHVEEYVQPLALIDLKVFRLVVFHCLKK